MIGFNWGLVLAVHLIGVVIWIGGLFHALAVVSPGMNATMAPHDRRLLHRAMLRRFFRVVWHAMPLVVLSGYAMLFGFYGGFGQVGWPVHLMHLLGLIMAGVFVFTYYVPWRAGRDPDDPLPMRRVRLLAAVNLALGFATIVVASLGHFG